MLFEHRLGALQRRTERQLSNHEHVALILIRHETRGPSTTPARPARLTISAEHAECNRSAADGVAHRARVALGGPVEAAIECAEGAAQQAGRSATRRAA